MKDKLHFWLVERPLPALLLLLALFYLSFTAAALVWHDGDPLWFVWIGTRFQHHDPAGNTGYDGQFVYYTAIEGLAAADKLDVPAYRLQRILYPLLVRAVSLGQPEWVPWSMLLINLAAILVSAYLLGWWLQKQGLSAWYALAYSLFVGTFMAYSRDLTEPLAYSLVIAGLVGWLTGRRPLAILLLALSALTKEQTVLFVLALGFGHLLRRQWRLAFLLGLAPIPLLLWELFLYGRFHMIPLGAGSVPGSVPLAGIITQMTTEPGRISGLLFVAMPAAGLLGAVLVWLRREWQETAVWLLLLQAIFVLLLPIDVYDHIMHAGRNSGGLVIAAVLAFPLMGRWLRRGLLAWWVLPTFVWLLPVLRWAPWTQ